MSDSSNLAIGVDIGGTKTAAVIAKGAHVVKHVTIPTPHTGLEGLEVCIAYLVVPWLERHGKLPVGVCTPGLLDPDTGIIRYASNLQALTEVDLAGRLTDRLGVHVHVENDANAAAYAEYHYGAARDWQSAFYLTISTGIGGGFVNQHGVFRGARGYAADVGHMTINPDGPVCSCGARGCLEAYTSGRFIAKHASDLYRLPLTTSEVFAKAKRGEPQALAIVDQAARYLALGLANTAKVLDPDGLLIGGGVSSVGPFFLDKIRYHLEGYLKNFRPIEVRLAELGTRAGVIGASTLALHRVFGPTPALPHF